MSSEACSWSNPSEGFNLGQHFGNCIYLILLGDCPSLRAWEVSLLHTVFSFFLCKFFRLRFGPESFFCICVVYVSEGGFVKCILLEYPDTCSITKKCLMLWEICGKSRSCLPLGFPLRCYCIFPPLQERAWKSCEYRMWGNCWRNLEMQSIPLLWQLL